MIQDEVDRTVTINTISCCSCSSAECCSYCRTRKALWNQQFDVVEEKVAIPKPPLEPAPRNRAERRKRWHDMRRQRK